MCAAWCFPSHVDASSPALLGSFAETQLKYAGGEVRAALGRRAGATGEGSSIQELSENNLLLPRY